MPRTMTIYNRATREKAEMFAVQAREALRAHPDEWQSEPVAGAVDRRSRATTIEPGTEDVSTDAVKRGPRPTDAGDAQTTGGESGAPKAERLRSHSREQQRHGEPDLGGPTGEEGSADEAGTVPSRGTAETDGHASGAADEPEVSGSAITRSQEPLSFDPPEGEPDDLTIISGIGPALAARLNGIGIVKYGQLASLTDEEIATLDEQLGLIGRVQRDDWPGQAAKLVVGGGETE